MVKARRIIKKIEENKICIVYSKHFPFGVIVVGEKSRKRKINVRGASSSSPSSACWTWNKYHDEFWIESLRVIYSINWDFYCYTHTLALIRICYVRKKGLSFCECGFDENKIKIIIILHGYLVRDSRLFSTRMFCKHHK